MQQILFAKVIYTCCQKMAGLIILFVILSTFFDPSVTIDSSALTRELAVYDQQIRILYDLITERCPGTKIDKRALTSDELSIQLVVKKAHFERLTKLLVVCKRVRLTTTPTMPTTVTTTTKRPTVPVPAECKTATNLTEGWRLEHNGKKLRPDTLHSDWQNFGCDFHKDLKWFRFSSFAGKSFKHVWYISFW